MFCLSAFVKLYPGISSLVDFTILNPYLNQTFKKQKRREKGESDLLEYWNFILKLHMCCKWRQAAAPVSLYIFFTTDYWVGIKEVLVIDT